MPLQNFIKEELTFWNGLSDGDKIKTLEFATNFCMLANVLTMLGGIDEETSLLANSVREFVKQLPE